MNGSDSMSMMHRMTGGHEPGVSRRLALIVASLVLLAGCSGSGTPLSPTPPAPASPIGTWVGTFSDPVLGEANARLSLAEQPPGSGGLIPTPQGAMAGTWSLTFRNGETTSGSASGSLLSGLGYAFSLFPDAVPPCALGPGPGSGLLQYVLVNVVVTPSRLTAAASRVTCAGSTFGTVSLSRQ